MTRWIVSGLGALMLLGVTQASAETTSTPSPSAFEQLSPGNRRTATALFEAQKTSPTSARPLTLEQIAQERRSGKSWGEIFQVMKSQGLIKAETLAQVLGRYDRARHSRL